MRKSLHRIALGEGAAHVQLGAVGATDCQSGTVGALSVAPTVQPTRRVAGSCAANLLGQGAKSPEGRGQGNGRVIYMRIPSN